MSLLLTEIVIVAAGLCLVGRGVLGLRALRRFAAGAAASVGMWGVSFAAHDLGTIPSVSAGLLTFVVLARVLHLLTPEELDQIRRRLPFSPG